MLEKRPRFYRIDLEIEEAGGANLPLRLVSDTERLINSCFDKPFDVKFSDTLLLLKFPNCQLIH